MGFPHHVVNVVLDDIGDFPTELAIVRRSQRPVLHKDLGIQNRWVGCREEMPNAAFGEASGVDSAHRH